MDWICVGLNLLFLTIVLLMGVNALVKGEIVLNDKVFKRRKKPLFYWLGIGVCLLLSFFIIRDILHRMGLI